MTDSRIALGVEYDGTNYFGFQKQKSTNKVETKVRLSGWAHGPGPVPVPNYKASPE